MDGIERFEKLTQEQQEYIRNLINTEIYEDEDGDYYMYDLDDLLDELEDEYKEISQK